MANAHQTQAKKPAQSEDYRDAWIVILMLVTLASLGYAFYVHSQYATVLDNNTSANSTNAYSTGNSSTSAAGTGNISSASSGDNANQSTANPIGAATGSTSNNATNPNNSSSDMNNTNTPNTTR
jgi:hypothetical protein